jgi:hypothetical protein
MVCWNDEMTLIAEGAENHRVGWDKALRLALGR